MRPMTTTADNAPTSPVISGDALFRFAARCAGEGGIFLPGISNNSVVGISKRR